MNRFFHGIHCSNLNALWDLLIINLHSAMFTLLVVCPVWLSIWISELFSYSKSFRIHCDTSSTFDMVWHEALHTKLPVIQIPNLFTSHISNIVWFSSIQQLFIPGHVIYSIFVYWWIHLHYLYIILNPSFAVLENQYIYSCLLL